MKHRKTHHPETNQRCKEFASNRCDRSENECWYSHSNNAEVSSPKKQPKQVFQQAQPETFPPDQLSKMFWMVSNLCMKVQNIEKKFEELMV